MLSLFTESLHLRLTHRSITLLKTSGWPRTITTVAGNARFSEGTLSNPDRFSKALAAVLEQAKCRGMATSVTLADELVRLFMVTPPQNIGRLADCHAAAAMRFQALYDQAPSAWKIDANWDVRHPFLACAMPVGLLSSLQEACVQHRLKLIEIQPQFVTAYNRCRKALGSEVWLGSVQGSALTLGAFDQQRLAAIRPLSLPASAWQDDEVLPNCLEREALRLGLSAPQQIQICGDFPGHWASRKIGSLLCVRLPEPIIGPSNSAPAGAVAPVNAGEPA
jgi:hypothetical protein